MVLNIGRMGEIPDKVYFQTLAVLLFSSYNSTGNN